MLGIYIHIPFCVKKCGYCDFFSVPAGRGNVPHGEYRRALVAQLEGDSVACVLKGRVVDTIYFGGGTPSLMPPEFFTRIISSIANLFSLNPSAEITAEVNPGTVSLEWFRLVREAGITRVSIGVQSFNPRLLKTLGRIHTGEDATRAIVGARDSGFKNVGADLMYAIPGEAADELEDDLRAAMELEPEHISAYQLTLEEGTPMRERAIAVSDDFALKQMRVSARVLDRSGLPRYEISNFAKPGFECLHNLNYWRYGEYLGLGAGATSFICTSERRATSDERRIFARRWTQVKDVGRYIGGAPELAEEDDINSKTAMGEFCFMGLRTAEGISPARFKENFNADFETAYGNECVALIEDGLLGKMRGRLALTQRGVELSNQVFERFL